MANTVDMNAPHNSGAVVGQNDDTMNDYVNSFSTDLASQCIKALVVTDARAMDQWLEEVTYYYCEWAANSVKTRWRDECCWIVISNQQPSPAVPIHSLHIHRKVMQCSSPE
jgi:hypothetical protein